MNKETNNTSNKIQKRNIEISNSRYKVLDINDQQKMFELYRKKSSTESNKSLVKKLTRKIKR